VSAHCSEVLSPSADLPGVTFLRIVERVEGFILQRFDERGDSLGDLQFETLDEAMRHVYSESELAVLAACIEECRRPGTLPRGLTGASDGPSLDAECCMPVTTRQVENFEGGADDHS
jgi:hypothetical protein